MYKKRLVALLVSIFALGVVFGIFVVEYDTFSLRAVFVAAALLSVLYIFVSNRYSHNIDSKRVSAVALAVAAFSFGVLRVSLYNHFDVQLSHLDGLYDNVLLEVTEVNSNYLEAFIVSSENGAPDGEKIRIYPNQTTNGFLIGDRISAEIRYKYKDSVIYRSNGIALTSSATVTSHEKGSGILYSIRKSVADNSNELYGDFEYAADISKAVSIGDTSSLDSYIYSLYKSSGISHVLAISGLHLSLFSFTLYSVLSAFRFKRRFVTIASVLSAIAYAAIVGFTAGVVRAVIMFVFVMILGMFKRRSDGITALFISLALLIVINPYSICAVGLQLSYLCSLGIILAQPMMDSIKSFFAVKARGTNTLMALVYNVLPAIITPLIVTFASTVFSFPVICTSFDTISYISPLINIFTVPLFSYGIGFSLLSFIIAPLCMPIAKIIAYPAGILFDFVTDITELVYRSEIGSMSVYTPLIIVPVILSLVMIIALVFMDSYKVRVFICSAVAFAVSLYVCCNVNAKLNFNKTFIEYGDMGGEYVYYQSNEMNYYVDVGGYLSDTDAVYKNGLVSLDGYFVISYDKYTLKRVESFTGNMRVERIFTPEPDNYDECDIYLQIKELANRRNCDIITYDKELSYALNENTLFEVYIDTNDSKMLRFQHMGTVIRFVGGDCKDLVYGDVAVLLDDYIGNGSMIYADEAYADNDLIRNTDDAVDYLTSFDDKLIINFDDSERRFNIYEP